MEMEIDTINDTIQHFDEDTGTTSVPDQNEKMEVKDDNNDQDQGYNPPEQDKMTAGMLKKRRGLMLNKLQRSRQNL